MSATKPLIGVAASRCNHDTVDGETVILDSTTGILTLLVGSGPAIWERLVGGVDRVALVAEVADAYGDAAKTDTERFLDELIAAELVVEIDAVVPGAPRTPWSSVYAAPQIERYDDIADIMTMDPIHEVDTTRGWPHAAVDEAREST